jgi:hypothetical protein
MQCVRVLVKGSMMAMQHAEHFAEAFSTEPGLCERFVPALGGQPQQCW